MAYEPRRIGPWQVIDLTVDLPVPEPNEPPLSADMQELARAIGRGLAHISPTLGRPAGPDRPEPEPPLERER